MVITGLTRNQFVLTDTRVRIPPSPPNRKALLWECFSIWYRHINKDLKGSGNEWEPKWLPEPRLTEERSKAEINSGLRRSDENQVLSH